MRQLTLFPKMRWTLIHQGSTGNQNQVEVVSPFSLKPVINTTSRKLAPLLNLSPQELYPQLFEQYLFSVLYKAFYLSFLTENRERLRHMDGALRTLEKNWNHLRRVSNELRQEEITEELEIIMLSAEQG